MKMKTYGSFDEYLKDQSRQQSGDHSRTSALGEAGRARVERVGEVGKRMLDRQQGSCRVRLLRPGLRAIRFLQGIILEGPERPARR